MKSKFHATLLEHSEGVSVSCPELPGCHSQGAIVRDAGMSIEQFNRYRFRVGDYRIIYEIYDAVLLVLILAISDGKDIYR